MDETNNLMQFLLREYNKYLETVTDEAPDESLNLDEEGNILELESFINWSTIYLWKVNQPINIVYMQNGIGLKLAHGQILGFAKQPEKPYKMEDEGVPVTSRIAGPRYRLIDNVTNEEIHITGG